MNVAATLAQKVGVRASCGALSVPRSSFYHERRKEAEPPRVTRRPTPARALSRKERHQVVEVLNSERFADCAPREIWAALLDEGRYLCSVRTMYRVLSEEGQIRERRDQLRHPEYKKPELMATGPNQVWSWDITKLKGPVKWTYYYLFVILDIFSRHVVGWMVAGRENGSFAKSLIEETVEKQGVDATQLLIHSDRGAPMKSKLVAQLLADLGVTKTHSRPHVCDDNPYSESQFKTMKYRPEFPSRFGSIQDARSFCREFFHWYNTGHHHTGIGLLTPEDVHYGRADQIMAGRAIALEKAYWAHPERFVKGPPAAPRLPGEVWINPPERKGGKSDDTIQ